MSERAAFKYIDTHLQEGTPKHTVYRELLKNIPYKQDVLTYLAMCPDPAVRKKLNTANNVLLALVIITLLIEVFFAYVFFKNLKSEYVFEVFTAIVWFAIAPWILVWSAILIRRFRGIVYGAFGFFSLIRISMTFNLYGDVTSWAILNVHWLVAAFLSLYISRKAFPYYKFFVKLDMDKLERDLLAAEKIASENSA